MQAHRNANATAGKPIDFLGTLGHQSNLRESWVTLPWETLSNLEKPWGLTVSCNTKKTIFNSWPLTVSPIVLVAELRI